MEVPEKTSLEKLYNACMMHVMRSIAIVDEKVSKVGIARIVVPVCWYHKSTKLARVYVHIEQSVRVVCNYQD